MTSSDFSSDHQQQDGLSNLPPYRRRPRSRALVTLSGIDSFTPGQHISNTSGQISGAHLALAVNLPPGAILSLGRSSFSAHPRGPTSGLFTFGACWGACFYVISNHLLSF